MKQSEFIKELSVATGFAQVELRKVFDALPGVVEKFLRNAKPGDTLEIPKIVKLKKAMTPQRKARTQFNSMLGRNIDIPAKPSEPTVRVYPTNRMKDVAKEK